MKRIRKDIKNDRNIKSDKKTTNDEKTKGLVKIPFVIINHVIVPFLSVREACEMSGTCTIFKNVAVAGLKKLEETCLPRIEWICELRFSKKLSKKQEVELKSNFDANRQACQHTEFNHQVDRDKVWQNIQDDIHRSNHTRVDYQGYLCMCNVRRFIPIIKKTVNSEDTIHSYSGDSPCKCLHSRHHTASQTSQASQVSQDINYQICGTYCWYIDPKLSETSQFLKILETIRFKLLADKYGGLDNKLIRKWLSKVGLLDTFK